MTTNEIINELNRAKPKDWNGYDYSLSDIIQAIVLCGKRD
jgi:hypothetical protein